MTLSSNYENITGTFTEYTNDLSATPRELKVSGSYTGRELYQLRRTRLNNSTTRKTALSLKPQAQQLFAELPKTLDDLFTLPVPDITLLQKQCMDILFYLMVHCSDSYVFENSEAGEQVKWINWLVQTKETADKHLCDEDILLIEDNDIKEFMKKYAKPCSQTRFPRAMTIRSKTE